jgi:hypothetical protein
MVHWHRSATWLNGSRMRRSKPRPVQCCFHQGRPLALKHALAFCSLAVTTSAIVSYEEVRRSTNRQAFEIPEVYKRVLLRLNGATVFRINLFGLPATMCQDPPMLDRSARQPLDLGTANASWRKRYAPRPSQLQFGSGPYSYEENTAYFLNEDGSIDAPIAGGRRVRNWPSLGPFLATELARAEALFEAAVQPRI